MRKKGSTKFSKEIVDKLPLVRPSCVGDKPFVESYAKIVMDESKEDPEAGCKDMECLELEQDSGIEESLQIVRRSNVKKEINGIVASYESTVKKIKSPPQDPCKFPDTSSKVSSDA